MAAQTKAIRKTFSKGILLRGSILDDRVSSGRLYKIDKIPSMPAQRTVGILRKGRCVNRIDALVIRATVGVSSLLMVNSRSSRSMFRVLI